VERMSTLDAGFYFVEHQNVPMHFGLLAEFEGPAPAYEDLLALYASKLPRVPRYRQVVRTTPMQLFRPYWADDENFELRYHVRHVAVPPPGGPENLTELASLIFAQQLDRARPLWEAWFIEGLEDDRWAIVSKVHHCMVDGIGGSDLMAALFDLGQDFERPVPVPWAPRPGPSVAEVVASGAVDTLTWPARQLAGMPGFVLSRISTKDQLVRFSEGLTGSARRLAAPSASSLNGPISPHRRWTWAIASLSEVKRIRYALDVTVNDVVLAVITTGFRDLLAARGELKEDLVVRTLVPVSLRGDDDRNPVSNKISAILVNLPVGEPGPVSRLELLHDQMEDLKRTRQAIGAEVLTEMLGFAAPALLALGSRAAFRIPQPLVQAVTTNVPGPRFPLYILGRQMVEVYPYVPIGQNVRIGIAVFSYLDRFSFGITADHGAVPESELATLARGISRGLDELSERVKPPRSRKQDGGTSQPAAKPGGKKSGAAADSGGKKPSPAKDSGGKKSGRAKDPGGKKSRPARH
jgi:diacylglycerol O-acyltransferase / wax synthase